MPAPTLGDVHVDRPLTNISVAFMQKANKFIAEKVFPMVPVQKKSDTYYTYDRDAWFRDEMEKRAPGTESAGSGYSLGTDSYNADVWALHKDVDDQIRSNSDQPLDADRDATLFLTKKGFLRKEKEFQSSFFTTGLWTGSTTGTDIVPSVKWDNASSTPIEDVDAEADAMEQKTGYRPNTMVVTSDVHRALKNHPDIRDRIKYVQKAILTEELLAALFGVERYLVARATNNIAAEGAALDMNFIFGSAQAFLCYANPTPSLLEPSAGYTFTWTGLMGGGAMGTRMKKFRMEHLSSDRLEIDCSFDMKLVAADLGVFFNTVLT